MKEKTPGQRKGFLRGAGIAADRREELVCVGIVEGGTLCFVYSRKTEDLDPRPPPPPFFSFFIINVLIDIAVNSDNVDPDAHLVLFKVISERICSFPLLMTFFYVM